MIEGIYTFWKRRPYDKTLPSAFKSGPRSSPVSSFQRRSFSELPFEKALLGMQMVLLLFAPAGVYIAIIVLTKPLNKIHPNLTSPVVKELYFNTKPCVLPICMYRTRYSLLLLSTYGIFSLRYTPEEVELNETAMLFSCPCFMKIVLDEVI